MTGSRQLFFYWRVAIGDREVALSAVRGWQRERMLEFTGLRAMLFVRTDAPQDRSTLMEVYLRASPAGIDADTQSRLAAEGDRFTAPWRQGDRKLEAFEQVS